MPGIVFLPTIQLRLQGASYPLCTVHHTRFFELSTALGELYPLTIEPRSSGGLLASTQLGKKKSFSLRTGKVLAHEAQNAPAADRAADRSPRPERRPGKVAMARACASAANAPASDNEQNVSQMASSCKVA